MNNVVVCFKSRYSTALYIENTVGIYHVYWVKKNPIDHRSSSYQHDQLISWYTIEEKSLIRICGFSIHDWLDTCTMYTEWYFSFRAIPGNRLFLINIHSRTLWVSQSVRVDYCPTKGLGDKECSEILKAEALSILAIFVTNCIIHHDHDNPYHLAYMAMEQSLLLIRGNMIHDSNYPKVNEIYCCKCTLNLIEGGHSKPNRV